MTFLVITTFKIKTKLAMLTELKSKTSAAPRICNKPINMPVSASTGPVLVLCCQHRPSIGPVLAHNGMFMAKCPAIPTNQSNVEYT